MTNKIPPQLAQRLLRLVLPAVLIVIAMLIQFTDPQFRARIRDNAFDQLQSLFPQRYRAELPLRVVAIDEASLARLGQWPWSRMLLAEMVDKLTDMGARVVAIDVVLAEADRTSPEQMAQAFPQQRALQQALRRLPAHDVILAKSFARGNVVLGFPIEPQAAGGLLPPAKARFLSYGGNAGEWLADHGGALAGLPRLTHAAKGSGAISLEAESDGVLRAVPLLYQVRGMLYPGLSLETLRLFESSDSLALQIDAPSSGKMPGIAGVALDNKTFFPTTPDGRVWLHFRPLAEERYVSAKDLLAGKVAEGLIRDHIVFIGATAIGLGDTIYSPLGELLPGIEAHVQLTEQLMTGAALQRPAWENDWLLATLLVLWLLLGWMLARFRPLWAVLLAALVLLGIFAFALWLFVAQHLLLDPFYPALVVSVLFLAMVVPRYLQTESEQRWIRNAFSRYVSPNRVKYLQANPQQLELGAVYRECSFVLTDLEGFTPLMEQFAPDKLASIINEYLEGMIQIVFKHDGTLDRIVGDAVMVIFSAPLVQQDHAARALACALEMDVFAQECCRRQRELGVPFGRTRIGVNSGEVLIGNFGGKSMLDYRALGDPINTAARLESINKQLGTRICVSGSTVALCPGFTGRPAGRLVFKGKSEAVATFEALSADQASEPRIAEYRAVYQLMERENQQALQAFQKLSEKYPDDALAAFHAKRLAAGEKGCIVVANSK